MATFVYREATVAAEAAAMASTTAFRLRYPRNGAAQGGGRESDRLCDAVVVALGAVSRSAGAGRSGPLVRGGVDRARGRSTVRELAAGESLLGLRSCVRLVSRGAGCLARGAGRVRG